MATTPTRHGDRSAGARGRRAYDLRGRALSGMLAALWRDRHELIETWRRRFRRPTLRRPASVLILATALSTMVAPALIGAGAVEIGDAGRVFWIHTVTIAAFLIAALYGSVRADALLSIVVVVFVAVGVVLFFAGLYAFYPVGGNELAARADDGAPCALGPAPPGEEAQVAAGCPYMLHAWRDRLYFSIVTFTTLGYGDYRPFAATRLVAALEAVYGMVFVGIFVGLVVSRMTEERAARRHALRGGAMLSRTGSARPLRLRRSRRPRR